MTNTNKSWVKFFFGLGILAVMSGVYLTFRGDYIGGISGSIVGAFIAWQNMDAINSNSEMKDEIEK